MFLYIKLNLDTLNNSTNATQKNILKRISNLSIKLAEGGPRPRPLSPSREFGGNFPSPK